MPPLLAVGDGPGLEDLLHPPHEEQRREHHSHRDAHHHVEDHGQDEAGEEHRHVAPGRDAENVPEVLHLRHPPGDGQQQRGHRRQREPAEERREEDHRQEHEEGVEDARQR
jgi:hypothetical protein